MSHLVPLLEFNQCSVSCTDPSLQGQAKLAVVPFPGQRRTAVRSPVWTALSLRVLMRFASVWDASDECQQRKRYTSQINDIL
jgi:hypothetical protein